MQMLSCAEFLTEFGDYLDNVASADLRLRLEEHLRECKACRVIVDSTQKTIKIVTDHDTFTISSDNVEPIVSEVMARVRRKSAPGA
jgi:predicted anti-sigma-YlaC factor YlaD